MSGMKSKLKNFKAVKKFLNTNFWKNVRSWLYCYGAPLNVIIYNRKKIKRLRNRFKGERCFIIGNGPSLNENDLDLIKDEYCFGQNLIYKIYPKTKWRPSFYCVQDFGILSEMGDDFSDAVQDSQCVFVRMFGYSRTKERLSSLMHKVYYVPLYCKSVDDIKSLELMGFSTDASKYLVDGDTVTYMSMQLAAYMGFERIYLLGMDFNFPLIVDLDDNLVSESNVAAHFYETAEAYKDKIKDDGKQHGMPREIQLNAYNSAKKYAEKSGKISIYNSTRGGMLEVFDRIELEDVLHNS